ncbi:MAG: DEAD/DEAH box helicase [Gammaproteobacteria bacterium]
MNSLLDWSLSERYIICLGWIAGVFEMGQASFLIESEPKMTLRPYQVGAVEDLRSLARQSHKRIILQAGTGSGKTIIACEIIKSAIAKSKSVLFLAHRRELIDQCGAKLSMYGVPHGIIMAGRRRDPGQQVQVASIQTLTARAVNSDRMRMPPADLIVLDECHRSLAKTYVDLIELFPHAVTLGLTATPCRGDGRGLGEIYTAMAHAPPIKELINQGFLVPIRYYEPERPDLRGVKVRLGDYVESELEVRMDTDQLVGSVVENWGRLAEGRKTVVFASGVKHSIHLTREFCAAGVNSEHIDGNTPDEDRRRILNGLQFGDVQVVTNCMVLTEGWDSPPVSACVLARPTKSLLLYIQMAGRALRPHPGKKDCLIIDHSAAVLEHRFLDEPIPWSLEGEEKVQDRRDEIAAEKREPKPVTCPDCKSVFKGLAKCRACGWEPKASGEDVAWKSGELVEARKGKESKKNEYSPKQKAQWLGQLKMVMEQRGYQEGWAAHTYRKKFGVWPSSGWTNRISSIEPGSEVKGFVRHLQIKYAKGREAQQ